jgi:hypothetical protein
MGNFWSVFFFDKIGAMKPIRQMFAKNGEDVENAIESTYLIGGNPTNAGPNIANDVEFTMTSGVALCKNCA